MNNDETGEGSIPHDLMTQSFYERKRNNRFLQQTAGD